MTSKIALITGAGSGIGKAAALELARAGYGVALLGRRPEPLVVLAGEIGEAALALPTDVGESAAVRRRSTRPSGASAAWTCSSTTPAWALGPG